MHRPVIGPGCRPGGLANEMLGFAHVGHAKHVHGHRVSATTWCFQLLCLDNSSPLSIAMAGLQLKLFFNTNIAVDKYFVFDVLLTIDCFSAAV